MDKHELAVKRGEEAERLLNNPAFSQAFEDTRQALLKTWAALDTTDERYAEFAKDIHRKVKMLEAVERCLKEHITTGKINQKTIEAATKRPFSLGARNAYN